MVKLAGIVDTVAGWRFFKPLVFLACLTPGALLGWAAYKVFAQGDQLALTVDPIKGLEHATGQYALWILCITLSITPVRRVLGANRLQRVRRMLGVWAFTYAVAHLSVYLVFDQSCYSLASCDYVAIWQDIVKRPFIFMGMTAFLIMLALAITSTSGWVRRLKKNWQRLHRLVYVAAVAAIIHFIWIQKSDFSRPTRFAIWVGILFGIRIILAIRKRRARLPVRTVTA
jgi:sulfoxide reductase heme-binding subunit YedZ